MPEDWIAACGLDCEPCAIRRLPFDEKAAAECLKWFRDMGWLTSDEGRNAAIDRGMYCTGCRGSRSTHWSVGEDGRASCFILRCCVDEKTLAHCSECEGFPCAQLTEWSKQKQDYAAAFARLRSMKAETGGRRSG